jgi:hypothetical protein
MNQLSKRLSDIISDNESIACQKLSKFKHKIINASALSIKFFSLSRYLLFFYKFLPDFTIFKNAFKQIDARKNATLLMTDDGEYVYVFEGGGMMSKSIVTKYKTK